MLRINIERNKDTATIKLEGSVAGPTIVKLNRIWIENDLLADSTPLMIDLRNVTHADAWGVRALRDIQTRTGARLITSSPLTKYVAEDVARNYAVHAVKKVKETT